LYDEAMTIRLIGPGGAGKTTVGAVLAERLAFAFVDLDQQFQAGAGHISEYIARLGYAAYARENVETYRRVLDGGCGGKRVIALSSGFMTYSQDIHPDYVRFCRRIEESPTTFVLVPSLNPEICVAEIVRRQLARPFARGAAREEGVIRERFVTYVRLRARKIETMRPVSAIVDALLTAIRAELSAPKSPRV
jgi:shikimate kinase